MWEVYVGALQSRLVLGKNPRLQSKKRLEVWLKWQGPEFKPKYCQKKKKKRRKKRWQCLHPPGSPSGHDVEMLCEFRIDIRIDKPRLADACEGCIA
jgi:hypothetical protein